MKMINYITNWLFVNSGAFLSQIEAYLMLLFILVGCSTVKYVPIQTDTVVNYVDSVRYEVRDSVVIREKNIYKEYASFLDTLIMDAEGIAKAKAWNDPMLHMIQGTLETEPQKTQYKTIYKDRIVQKDSIITQEIPVPVEVIKEVKYIPKVYKYAFAFSIMSIIGLIVFLYFKFKNFRLPWI